MRKTLFNGKLITCSVPGEEIKAGGVVIAEGKIERVFYGEDFERAGELIDCRGMYISPGFVDIHTHSTFDGSVMDASADSLHAMTKRHALGGTTSLVATTLSAPHERIAKALDNIAVLMREPPVGARVLGAHLEGNYFSAVMAGAQNPAYLYAPEQDDYMDFIGRGCVRRISAAPELPGALDMARRAVPLGVQMSIGHSNGTPLDVEKAARAGYTSITHIYNAQSALTGVFYYPEGGVCEAALVNDDITAECICDGNHLSPTLLKLIYKIKGADGMAGITDSVYTGAPEGGYKFGGIDVEVKGNICRLKHGKAFAGSVATMDLCVRTLYRSAGIPLADAVRICSATPARLIGEKSIGMLAPGFDADINVFDDGVNIALTMILGVDFINRL